MRNWRFTIGAVMAAAIIAGGSVAASAAGFFTNGVPTAGGSQYPTTLPLTGLETIPADTNLPGGLNPASEGITVQSLIGAIMGAAGTGGIRNALCGGDFGTALWQRGVTVSGDIAATNTYYADCWWNQGGASSAINVTKATAAADITPGFIASNRFQRKSANADVAVICTGQALTSANSAKFQGGVAEFRVHILAGANFSAATSNVVMTIGYSVAGAADQTAANFQAGSWTGQVNVSQTTTISTTWARYSMVAAIPVTATQVGVKICYTPVGTAGANDWFEFTGAQLDLNAGAVAQTGVSNTAFNVASFDIIPAPMEALREQAYYIQINETNGGYFAPGMVDATNVEKAVLALPVIMRATPTCTYTAGTFKWDLNGTDTAVTTLTQIAGSTSQYLTIGDTTAGTAGQTAFLKGAGTAGNIKCSAEL